MANINKVILLGNVGGDPETITTANGKMISKFTLATNSKNKGETVTEWHKIVTFEKLAEIVSQYVKKGRSVYVEGRIQTNTFKKKDGTDGTSVNIVANEVQLVDKPQGGTNAQQPAPSRAPQPAPQAPQAPQHSTQQGVPSFTDEEFSFD